MTDEDRVRKAMQGSYSAKEYLGVAYELCMRERLGLVQEKMFQSRKKFYKQLQDEMLPIGYFCDHYFTSQPELVEVALVLGNQTYDAKVIDRRPDSSGIEYLEIACIEDNQEHESRMEMLEKGRSTISRSETDLFDLINGIISKKSPKNYPQNTALLMFSKIVYPELLYRNFEFEYASLFRPKLDARFKCAFILDRKKLIQL